MIIYERDQAGIHIRRGPSVRRTDGKIPYVNQEPGGAHGSDTVFHVYPDLIPPEVFNVTGGVL